MSTSFLPLTRPPMSIPELRLEVAEYLHQSDLCACALVCRAWNNTFTPLLYHDINDKNVNSHGVKRHCVHARRLHLIVGNSRVENLLAGPATRLQEMNITDQWVFNGVLPQNWILLLQQNPGLVKLTLRGMRPNTMDTIISLCPHVQELVVCDYRVQYQSSIPIASSLDTSFWKICQGLTHLQLRLTASPRSPGQSKTPPERLPRMRFLTMSALRSACRDQMQLVTVNTKLEPLGSDGSTATGDTISSLCLDLSTRFFQSLCRLRILELHIPLLLRERSLRDDWTRKLMEELPPLLEYHVPQSKLIDNTEGLVQGPLSRHFETLTMLNIRGWQKVTTEDNHLILTSCPSLRMFSSRSFLIGEIASVDDGMDYDNPFQSELGPLGWICTGLSEIMLEFTHETPEKSRLMFDQLCCMKELECVNLQGPKPGPKSGLNPILIQWDGKPSARFWRKGPTFFTGNMNAHRWMRAIWPKMRSFSTYS